MQKLLAKMLKWIGEAIAAQMLEPLGEIKRVQEAQIKQLNALEKRMEKLHAGDPIAEECDLAVLDDRICYLIGKCREKGYTTAEERRRVSRMHDAYKARGGNHGEENEYEIFKHLPTEEEHERAKGA